jgi:hypothetical protein
VLSLFAVRTTAPAGNSTSYCTSSTASQGLGPGTPAGCFACPGALCSRCQSVLATVFSTVASLREFKSGRPSHVQQRYLLTYSPRNVAKGGWHRIDVRVKNRRVSVKARAGYQSGA